MKKDLEKLIALQEKIQTLSDEIPVLVSTVKSTQNLPTELLDTFTIIEKNIEQSKSLLTSIPPKGGLGTAGVSVGAVGGVVGAAGGIFNKLGKKQAMSQYSGKKLTAIKDSATLFEETIHRMEHLLEKTHSSDDTPNYERLTAAEKEELLTLAEKMQNLSSELTQQLAA